GLICLYLKEVVLIGGSSSEVCLTPSFCVSIRQALPDQVWYTFASCTAIGQAPLNLCTLLPLPVLPLD
ncbi:Uncharacterized protein DAT39_008136, partial [Clarias magur]